MGSKQTCPSQSKSVICLVFLRKLLLDTSIPSVCLGFVSFVNGTPLNASSTLGPLKTCHMQIDLYFSSDIIA